jgi:DNA-binding transcriptional LysR family regulator
VLLNRLLARGKFRHVQVLLRLAELGSVQRTAESVGTSQSAVTQTLAYLEQLLETRLFERHARGVRPTRAGSELLPMARQLMNSLAHGAESLAALNQRGRALVRLTASPAAVTGLVVRVLPAFLQRHPGVEVVLKEAEGEDLLLTITRNEADIVAGRQPAVIPEGWTFHPVLADELVVITAPDHPLARKRKLPLDRLAGQEWLLPPVGSVARSRFDEWVPRLPDPERVYPLVTRTAVALWWALRGSRILGFAPRSAVRHLVEIGELTTLSLQETIPMEPIGILAPAGEHAGPVGLLMDYLRSTA